MPESIRTFWGRRKFAFSKYREHSIGKIVENVTISFAGMPDEEEARAGTQRMGWPAPAQIEPRAASG